VRVTTSLTTDLLYGPTASDAANLVTAVAVIFVFALAACAWRALKATRVDPLLSIRED
jgi:hypothetical protein